jgi:hypothetical protein
LGAVHNQRSLIALDNLVGFIALCADRDRSPAAANQTFLLSDGADVSTPQLLQKLGQADGKRPWLIPIPTGADAAGCQAYWQGIGCGSAV